MIFATTKGKLDSNQDAEVQSLGAELAKPGAKLLLHLHGGLVDDERGRAIADRLAGPAPRGLGLGSDWSQAYLVWHTGALETIRANWTDLATNDRLYRIVLRKLVEFVASKLETPGVQGRSAAKAAALTPAGINKLLNGDGDRRAPFADLDRHIEIATPGGRGPVIATGDDGTLAIEFQDVLANDQEFNNAAADIDAIVNEKAAGRSPLSAGDRQKGEAAYNRLSRNVRGPIDRLKPTGVTGRTGPIGVAAFLLKHAARIALRTFKRFRTHRDHGFHATLVEEVGRELYGDLLGATVWGMMVQEAADHFKAGGFGQKLLAMIPDNNQVRIVITAHSAGAIVAAEFLKAIKATNKTIDINLVLLAPAARSDLFAEAIEASGHRVKHCRMFTMSDELERQDAVLGHDKGYIYPSSLLYLVSGMFEEIGSDAFVDAPLVGMQRFVGAPWLADAKQIAAVRLIAEFFQRPDHGIIYSPAPGISMADTHGGFDSEKETLASVAQFLAKP